MIYGYIRVSTDKQTVENQRFEIENFCRRRDLVIDKWFEETISGTKEPDKRKLGILMSKMQKGDIVICAELSRLGRNLLMIMSILNHCMTHDIVLLSDPFNASATMRIAFLHCPSSVALSG